jgi:hypothetical protein
MKLYTEKEIEETLESMGCELMVNDFFQMSEPIELPSHRDIMERANQQVDKNKDNYFVGFAACSEYYEQILRQLPII